MTTRAPSAIRLLEPHDCWAHLRTVTLGRLAVVVAGRPAIFPVNYLVDHGTIVFRTAEGTKLSALTVDSHVCFEADGIDDASGAAWSVVVDGRAERIRNMHELFDTASLPLFPWHSGPKDHVIRVLPDRISGRSFGIDVDTALRTRLVSGRRAAVE